jgi:predicted transcriptional regulator
MKPTLLFDSEWRLMELVWERSPVPARDLSLSAAERLRWNKNTTYTVLKKLVAKGAVRREEPGFLCSPLIGREEAQHVEARNLIDRLYDGSVRTFFSAFLDRENLTETEVEELRRILDEKGRPR